MDTGKEHIDELIAKYLSGEALPDEAIMLDDWKRESPVNMEYFRSSEHTFNLVHGISRREVDLKGMFGRIMEEAQVTPAQPARIISLNTYFTPMRIAATLLLVSLIGLTAYYFTRTSTVVEGPPVMIASGTNAQQQKLADGSEVFLNKHSKLTVSGSFNNKERKLKLEGEAFFEVKHSDKPFVIEAGGVQIQDIGTAFNVKAEPGSDSVMVFVTEGIVDVKTEQTSLRLYQNQGAIYIRSADALVEMKTGRKNNITAYKTKVFHFQAAKLADVLADLNEVYDNRIRLENKALDGCRITVDFNDEPIETIVMVITETLGLTFEAEGNSYTIKGPQCIQ